MMPVEQKTMTDAEVLVYTERGQVKHLAVWIGSDQGTSLCLRSNEDGALVKTNNPYLSGASGLKPEWFKGCRVEMKSQGHAINEVSIYQDGHAEPKAQMLSRRYEAELAAAAGVAVGSEAGPDGGGSPRHQEIQEISDMNARLQEVWKNIQVDVYMDGDQPRRIVLWEGAEPVPKLCLKVADDGSLSRFTLVSEDDIPSGLKRDSHLNMQVTVKLQGDAVEGLSVAQPGRLEPVLQVGIPEGRTHALHSSPPQPGAEHSDVSLMPDQAAMRGAISVEQLEFLRWFKDVGFFSGDMERDLLAMGVEEWEVNAISRSDAARNADIAQLYREYGDVRASDGASAVHRLLSEHWVKFAAISRKGLETVSAVDGPEGGEASWRFGATKGSIYMYPSNGGVQAGYKWVATTDPELVGMPEDQEAMAAMARRLADSANACLGMKDPVAEVAQLRAASQRVAGTEMDGAQRDRNAAASSEPGLGR